MNVIATRADLKKATPDEIEAAIASINFRGWVKEQMEKSGSKPGMTREEWQKFVDERQPEECPTCHGRGTVLPKVRTVGTLHASSAHQCVTRLYYDVMGEVAPAESLPMELQITFMIGHAIHATIQGALHDYLGENFEDEVRVDLPEAMICNGSADGVVTLPRCRALLEIKTISGDEFDKLRKPKAEHIVQAVGMYASGLDVPFVSFLYVSKSWPHDLKEYVVPYDETIFMDWYNKKGRKIEEALENGAPPKADAASPYECKKCNYGTTCPQALIPRDKFRR